MPSGKWKTVVEDMGIPSGKPKTIVVDLTGKFLSRSREVRIVTNLCVYWDEIFLIEDSRRAAGSPHASRCRCRGSAFPRFFAGGHRSQPPAAGTVPLRSGSARLELEPYAGALYALWRCSARW